MIISRAFWSLYAAWCLRGQARYPFQDRAVICRDQNRRIAALIPYAFQRVPYYRETMGRQGLTPDDIHSVEDLEKLPIIERIQVQRDPEYFMPEGRRRPHWLKLRTGGSTGEPVTVYHDPRAVIQVSAAGLRGRSIIHATLGKSFGYRETFIASGVPTARKYQKYLESLILRPPGTRIERQELSVTSPPEELARQINRFQPDIIGAYGSCLELLFSYLKTSGGTFHKPRLITYGADPLSDSKRRLIEEEFKIPVFTTYRTAEFFPIGFECGHHTGQHLNADLFPLRISDEEGRTLPDGQDGSVIVSSLVNRATVLINYRLGDLAHRIAGSCPCGRSLPLLSNPLGKNDDMIRLPDGRTLHTQAVRVLFNPEPEIWQYQVVQIDETHFHVEIVADESCDRSAIETRMIRRLAGVLGAGAGIEIAFVSSIPRNKAGKLCAVTSRVWSGPDIT